jgi:putative membrane protein (TIGR04086 family)
MKHKGKTRNSLSPMGELLKYSMIGSAISIICLVIFSLIAAFVISKSDLPHRLITPISIAIIGVSAFIGSLIAGRMLHKKGLVLGILTAVITFAIMLIALASEPVSCFTVSIRMVLESTGDSALVLDRTAKRVVFSALLLILYSRTLSPYNSAVSALAIAA